jgi:hypothetical protein
VSPDDDKEVVKIVSHARRPSPEGFQPLYVPKLGFDTPEFRDVSARTPDVMQLAAGEVIHRAFLVPEPGGEEVHVPIAPAQALERDVLQMLISQHVPQ